MCEIDESKIGGSDVYTILGLSHRSPAHLAMRLRGDHIPDDGLYGVLGRAAEPNLLAWYADRTGVQLNPSPPRFANAWARATPDGEAICPETGARWGVEVKFWDLSRRHEFGSPMSDDVSIQVMVQCQWYMACFPWDRMDVAVSFGNREPELYHLTSRPDIQRRLIRLARTFYRRAHAEGPLAVHGKIAPPTQEDDQAPVKHGPPTIDTMNKVRYLAKAARIEAFAAKRKKLAQAWAIQHVGNRPGRIVTPDATVSIYRTHHGSLAVRATPRRKRL